jgi:hypothetical protein
MQMLARHCRERCIVPALVCLALLLSPRQIASAQTVDATRWHSGTVTLNSGWREHEGDDPAWAKADFDDSGWQNVDLDDLGPAQPGWRWYRLHVKLAPAHPHVHLLIAGGGGTYELYLNGQRQDGAEIRSMFGVSRPTEQLFVPRDEDNDLTIAVRTHAPHVYTLWDLPLFLTAALGTPDAIGDEQASLEAQRMYSAIPTIAINLALVIAGIGALGLFLSRRVDREYMWLGLYLLVFGTSNGILYSSTSGVVSSALNGLVADPLFYIYVILQIEFTFSFARKPVSKPWRAYEGILFLMPLANPMPHRVWLSNTMYTALEGIAGVPAALLLPVVLFLWYRKGNREAGWLILPSLLPAATAALSNLGSVSLWSGWGKFDYLSDPIPLGQVSLQLTDVGDFVFLLAIGVVMFFRFTRVSREQTRVAAELEAAREIQHRLVPARLPQIPGYAIEAAYFPAQEVGGDFYQVLEHSQGAKLVVVGDVSGKGLKAAMTGTLAMGALRAVAAEELGPAAVLMRLNRQLVETGDGGFITCVCVRVSPGGGLLVANAGHLAPYRDGVELQVSTGLPLGILLEEKYSEQEFQLEPGQQLTLLSDGVLEATNAAGELFGFERMQAVSGKPAAAIAEAAQRFGQEDDITVLTLTRAGVPVADPAELHAIA